MKFKHIEDDGDLSMLINDEGEIVIVCSKGGHYWLGTFRPGSESEMVNKMGLTRALKDKAYLLEEVGMNAADIAMVMERG